MKWGLVRHYKQDRNTPQKTVYVNEVASGPTPKDGSDGQGSQSWD